MGIRIDAYAIDTPRLAELLERPVADLLALYAENARKSSFSYRAYDPETEIHFTALPDGRLSAGPEGRGRWLRGPEELGTFPQLKKTGREWYAGRWLYEVSHLLEAMSDCPDVTCVTRLIDGQYLSWIGSLLDAASTAWGPDDDRTSLLVRLFRKVLREFMCGFPIPNEDIGIDQSDLPFGFGPQEDDPGWQYGRWRVQECQLAMDLLSQLRSAKTEFRRPPECRVYGVDDTDWQGWVSWNVDSLLQMKTLDGEPELITIIE